MPGPGEPARVASRPTVLGAYGRGLLGAVAMAFSLGAAIAAGKAMQLYLGLSGVGLQLARGGLCSALAVSLIVLFRLKVDRLSWDDGSVSPGAGIE